MNLYMKRILAVVMAILMLVGGCIPSALAEEIVEEFSVIEETSSIEIAEEIPPEEESAEISEVEETAIEPAEEIAEEIPTGEEPVEISEAEETVIEPVEEIAEEIAVSEPVEINTKTGYPLLNDVRDQLNPDEILEIDDAAITQGDSFDLIDSDWLKSSYTFEVASDDDFSESVPGEYKIYYVVAPASGNPAYQISRTITVLEAESDEEATVPTETPEENSTATETEETEQTVVVSTGTSEIPVEEESVNAIVITDPENVEGTEVTVDGGETESEDETDTDGTDEIPDDNVVIEGDATVTRGSKISYPSDLAKNYSTFEYYVDGKFSYCVEADKSSPKGGSFAQEILETNDDLGKALYYGYGGPGDESGTYYPDYSSDTRTVLTHIAISYFYTGDYSRATKGCKSSGLKMYDVEGWIDYISNLPDPPSPKISLSDSTLEIVSKENGVQQTGSTTLNADSRNSITLSVPDNVTYHDKTNGTSQTGGSVTVSGGTTFYFTAPLATSGTWKTGEMKGSIDKIWKALVITTGTKTQNLGSYATETYSGTVALTVNWNNGVTLNLIKEDSEDSDIRLSGAVFGVYSDSDCTNQITTMTTNEDGSASCSLSANYGTVYLKELQPPEHYLLDETVHAVSLGDDAYVTFIAVNEKENPTRVSVSKADVTTGVELDGATLTVLDANGNVVETWESVADEPHIIEGLIAGETYTLREDIAPHGYLLSQSVQFTVSDTDEIQKVVMKDEVPTGSVIIHKTGEVLRGTSSGNFEYATESLEGVIFGIYADEAITNADGVTPAYYLSNDLVATITTDATGTARLDNLPLGHYYIYEIATVDGYVRDMERREIDLTYQDSKTEVITYEGDWDNHRRSAQVTIYKFANDTYEPLKGAIFGLYAAEDITRNGSVIMAKGTLIEKGATDEYGELNFAADIPSGFTYYVKELQGPDGYAWDPDDIREFTFESTYPDQMLKSAMRLQSADEFFEFDYYDTPTLFDFTKTSLTTGEPVEGAHLRLTDPDGNVIDEWISEQTEHRITGLTVGKTYTLSETLPADGYATAESVIFTAENTGEVQKVEMKDDVTKIQISKIDMGGNELEGATLTILDADGNVVESWTSGTEPHYLEMLPIGRYTLHEESAPDGYLVAEDITFEVLDTDEIQTVIMKDAAEPSDETPPTGDMRRLIVWIALGIAGMVGVVLAVIPLRKRKH